MYGNEATRMHNYSTYVEVMKGKIVIWLNYRSRKRIKVLDFELVLYKT